ncbi:DUF4912 domain-containing protein [Treponema maltophilum]|uniref:DUF4912 domain-containing protein n=1 Tax=Treponema maltophilum TaxID=51160 RepID=UPI003D8F6568
MERADITRSYLETLSSADLNDLAEEYGIDIPEDLTRRFVIAELLEAAVEDERARASDLRDIPGTAAESVSNKALDLPSSYNENRITAVLRNPAWCYVYWDIKHSDFSAATKESSFKSFVLRISYFKKESDKSPCDVFDISVEDEDREQFVLLSSGSCMLRADLIAEFSERRPMELCQSGRIPIPYRHPDISSISLRKNFPAVLALSGLPDLIRSQYNEHRQSFSSDD